MMCTEYNHLWSFGGIVDEVGAVGNWTVEAYVAYLGNQIVQRGLKSTFYI